MIHRPGNYKLIGKLAVLCRDLMEFAIWFETADRRVAYDDLGPCYVSTVFLGIDHNYTGRGDPLLFETMILGDIDECYQVRTSTWGQAEAAHAKALEVALEVIAKARALLPAEWSETSDAS